MKASLRTLAEEEAEAEAALKRKRQTTGDDHERERLDELKAMRAELLEAVGPGRRCSPCLRHPTRVSTLVPWTKWRPMTWQTQIADRHCSPSLQPRSLN